MTTAAVAMVTVLASIASYLARFYPVLGSCWRATPCTSCSSNLPELRGLCKQPAQNREAFF